MAANLNRIFLIGNLTRDPELRYVPSGTAVANFTVACNRVYVLQSGEKKEEVSFIRTVVWGRRAEVCGEYLSKGSPVFVEGRLRIRSWKAADGQNRSTTEVIASSVQFLGSSKSKQPPKSENHEDQSIASIDIDEKELNQDKQQPSSNDNEGEVPF